MTTAVPLPPVSPQSPPQQHQPGSSAQEGGEASAPPRTRRVLHVVNGQHYSGAARVQDLLALHLPNEGFEVGFACVKPDRFPTVREAQSAPLWETPMATGFDIRPAWRIARLVRDHDFDLLHAHTPRSILVARIAAALTGRPLVYHVHSPTSRDSDRPLQNWINDKVERLCARGAGRLLAVSESLQRHMRSLGFAGHRIRVAANGTPTLSLPARSAPEANAEWTLGMVALFRPRKGLETLLEALHLLQRDNRPVRLRAVGPFESPGYEAEIHALANRLGLQSQIDWVGMSETIPHELQQMELFVLPSRFGEGLPMVVLEAMSAGVPVLATRVEGIPEVVREGIDGLLTPPEDPAALAAAAARFLDGEVDWQAMSEAALERHREHFSAAAMAAKVAAAYREVLEPPRASSSQQ